MNTRNKTGLDLSSFTNIDSFYKKLSNLKNPSMQDIHSLRKDFSSIDKSWMEQSPIKTTLDKFEVTASQNRYTVNVDEVNFECLYFPASKKRLIISLNGGGAGYRRYPNFLRWKYKNYYDGHFICIDDPMYDKHPGVTHVMWYYGTKETSYLDLLIKIVKKLAAQLNIHDKNIIFLGSSGGGTAALYCAEHLDNSCAISMNPQLDLYKFSSEYMKNNFNKWGIDLSDQDKLERNIINLTNKTSRFAITSNVFSDVDYNEHFSGLCKRLGITPAYGINKYDNVLTWVHATDYSAVHSANPEREISIMMFLLTQMLDSYGNNNVCDDNIHAFSILANEYINERFELTDKILKLNNTIQKMVVSSDYAVVAFKHGKWKFFVNNEFIDSFTGIAKSTKGNWIFVRNGIFDRSFTGVAKSIKGNWIYAKEGRFDSSFSGIAKSIDGSRLLIEKGRWNRLFTGKYNNYNIRNGYVY